ncbi:MAG: DUF3794 domain-containing protein [Clostridiales bacterium]|nr:DUF3794 domain-containing protein [Clostridiales bacterium]
MPENINIKSDEIVWMARGQAVVEARQPINSDCKVLSVSASAVTTPSEVFAGEARYVGKVTFDCIVLVENAVRCVTAVAEFSDKITAPDITANTSVTLVPEIVNVEATIDGGTLKAVAVVDTAAVAVVDKEYMCIAQPDEGIYAEKRTVCYSTACAAESETVYITDSVGATKITDIMCSTARAVVTGADSTDGEIKISGAVYTFAVVKTDEDITSSVRIVTPFVKSVAAPVHDGDAAYAVAQVTDSSATLIAGENRIEVAATVRLNATALTAATCDVVTDVFCADNEIQTTKAILKCTTTEPLTTVIDTVDGQVPIDADRLAADNVLCVTGTTCALTSVKIDDRRVYVEGLVGGDIVYYNAEKNAVGVLPFRLPFSMPLNNHTEATQVTATAVVTDVNVKIRRESVFDIKAEIAFTLMLSTASECECISEVVKGEPLARPDASVIIHIAKEGETLWQAAKALCCSPERVTEQNSATAPYAGGERLINFCNK